MNVFVLCTGRCGSLGFARACGHIRNFTVGHESRAGRLGDERFAYPPRHIEVDNRLSWLLGRLQRHHGDEALYVHLWRDREQVADSFVRRIDRGIMKAYRGDGILLGLPAETDARRIALDYIDTVTANIQQFLRDKPRRLDFALEDAATAFPRLCGLIDAEVDLPAALAEFDARHHASRPA